MYGYGILVESQSKHLLGESLFLTPFYKSMVCLITRLKVIVLITLSRKLWRQWYRSIQDTSHRVRDLHRRIRQVIQCRHGRGIRGCYPEVRGRINRQGGRLLLRGTNRVYATSRYQGTQCDRKVSVHREVRYYLRQVLYNFDWTGQK